MEGFFAYHGEQVASLYYDFAPASPQDRTQGTAVICASGSLPNGFEALPKSAPLRCPVLLFVVRQFLAMGKAPRADDRDAAWRLLSRSGLYAPNAKTGYTCNECLGYFCAPSRHLLRLSDTYLAISSEFPIQCGSCRGIDIRYLRLSQAYMNRCRKRLQVGIAEPNSGLLPKRLRSFISIRLTKEEQLIDTPARRRCFVLPA